MANHWIAVGGPVCLAGYTELGRGELLSFGEGDDDLVLVRFSADGDLWLSEDDLFNPEPQGLFTDEHDALAYLNHRGAAEDRAKGLHAD